MIDVSKIVKDSLSDSVHYLCEGSKQNITKDDEMSQENIYKTLLNYSDSLLKAYHAALKAELAKQGINI